MSDINIPPLPFRTPHIAVTLAAHLEKLIATGELPPGTKLPAERELAQHLSVSRSSLREALLNLEAKNLLSRHPGRGTHVSEHDEPVHQLRELSADRYQQNSAAELRGIVEPSVAALAAGRATRANVMQLQDVIARTHTANTAQQSLERDIEFHLLLAHATFNPLITTLHGMMTEWTMDLRAHSHATAEGRTRSLRGHEEILAAVEVQDHDLAAEAMRMHLREVQGLIASEKP